MSAIFRCKIKLRHLPIRRIPFLSHSSSRNFHSSPRRKTPVSFSTPQTHPTAVGLVCFLQERPKWHGSSDNYDQIKAEVNCPRCSHLMTVLFSNRPLSITATETGIYQALNLCHNCRTAFYFRPFKLEPLQGTFIEIGRVKEKKDFEGNDGNGKKIWEKLRSYSGDSNSSGVVDKGVCTGSGAVIGEVPKGKGIEPRPEELASEGSEWGGANLGNDLPTPKEISGRLDEFVVGQEKAKKVAYSWKPFLSFVDML